MFIDSEKIYIIGIDKEHDEDGTMYYSVGGKTKTAKMYYNPVKSWAQYMSKQYGLYFIARHNGKQKKVYIVNLPEYR